MELLITLIPAFLPPKSTSVRIESTSKFSNTYPPSAYAFYRATLDKPIRHTSFDLDSVLLIESNQSKFRIFIFRSSCFIQRRRCFTQRRRCFTQRRQCFTRRRQRRQIDRRTRNKKFGRIFGLNNGDDPLRSPLEDSIGNTARDRGGCVQKGGYERHGN